MRSLLCAALNCLVGNEPRVAATASIAPSSMRPACDVGFVLIRNAEGEPIDFNSWRLCKMKDVLVAIVKKPLRIDWLEMTVRFYRCFDPHLALRVPLSLARERIEVRVAPFSVDRNRLDPVNRVLQKKSARGGRQLDHDLVGQHRIRWRRADIQKKRSVRS